MKRLNLIGVLAVVGLLPTLSMAAETGNTLTFGPVVLHEGSRLELCADAKYTENDIILNASFVRVKDGKALTKEKVLPPGSGGCFELQYEQVGDAPVFAAIEVVGVEEPEVIDIADIIASAAIINGIFEMPKSDVLLMDSGVRNATNFGPVTIPDGKRIEVCANNWKSEYATDLTVNFYRVGEKEPIKSRKQSLEPGKGACTSLESSQAGKGKGTIIAELLSDPVEDGFSNPLPVTGAFIINGLFDSPVPKQTVVPQKVQQ